MRIAERSASDDKGKVLIPRHYFRIVAEVARLHIEKNYVFAHFDRLFSTFYTFFLRRLDKPQAAQKMQFLLVFRGVNILFK